jgi:outer membrane protein
MLVASILCLAPLCAGAEDLLAVYDRAVINDPQIREAEALRRAAREARPQAIAALLPQATLSGNKGRDWSDGTGFQEFVFGSNAPVSTVTGGNGANDSQGWRLTLRQSVFSWANWATLKAASHQVAQAESNYLAARQALAQRVAQQYFAVLSAQDVVAAQEAARDAFARQLEQAEKRFEVGLIAITDVQEARAARDSANAAVIVAKRNLANAEEVLRATVGEKYARLSTPADDMPLQPPSPEVEDDWVKVSMEQNAALISSRLAADIAREQVEVAFSGHLPTVDLVAGRSYSDSSGTRLLPDDITRTNNASETYGKSISLQVTLPLFSGGSTQSRVRQSQYNWIAAKERLERTSRETERLARDAYLGVNSGISQVKALRQALESSQTALKATEAGYEVGTRTAVDVLESRRQLIQAQTNYSQSRYTYLNSLIQLRLASGDLDRETLAGINQWLQATAQ